ncbi:hypothetical protein CDEF62S_05199 [Castellaniella defragrans]
MDLLNNSTKRGRSLLFYYAAEPPDTSGDSTRGLFSG